MHAAARRFLVLTCCRWRAVAAGGAAEFCSLHVIAAVVGSATDETAFAAAICPMHTAFSL